MGSQAVQIEANESTTMGTTTGQIADKFAPSAVARAQLL
jgi:hypothetical protein